MAPAVSGGRVPGTESGLDKVCKCTSPNQPRHPAGSGRLKKCCTSFYYAIPLLSRMAICNITEIIQNLVCCSCQCNRKGSLKHSANICFSPFNIASCSSLPSCMPGSQRTADPLGAAGASPRAPHSSWPTSTPSTGPTGFRTALLRPPSSAQH